MRSWITLAMVALLAAVLLGGCSSGGSRTAPAADSSPARSTTLPTATPEAYALVEAALSQVGVTTSYDPAYVRLAYPGGDVPIETGVCSDVVVRALRGVGVDLQVAVHEDMKANFERYPRRWELDAPDPNIDHRRVPNIETFFERQGWRVPVSAEGRDYVPGDVVTWSVSGRPHIGIVTAEPADSGTRYLIVHNIGRGARVEDVLFRFEITGHFRSR